MIVNLDSKPESLSHAKLQTWNSDEWTAAWIGLIYLEGYAAGAASVQTLIQKLVSQKLEDAVCLLKGVFALCLFNKRTQTWQFLVDNSGLYHLFHDSERVGTSFLEILQQRTEKTLLHPVAVADFVNHGNIYWKRTFVEDISKFGFNEIVTFQPHDNGQTEKIVSYKNLTEESAQSKSYFAEHFSHLATAIRDQRVAVDFTGGIDSRMVAALLHKYGLPFEIGSSGRPHVADIDVPKLAAKILDAPLLLVDHTTDRLVEELPSLFRRCDGLCDILGYHRPGQFQAQREQRAIDVVVTGHGGGLFKDFWWLQDFPNYRSTKSNPARIYDLRFAPVPFPHRLCTRDMQNALVQMRKDTLTRLEDLVRPINTETNDAISFHYKLAEVAGAHLSNHINNHVNMAVPLLDFETYKVGYRLPRRERTFSRFHRELTTAASPELARLITAEGMTSSDEWAAKTRDLIVNIGNKVKRGVKKMIQRTTGKTFFQVSPTSPELYDRARKSAQFQSAVDTLKDAKILNTEVAGEDITSRFLGRVITMGMFLQKTNAEIDWQENEDRWP